jgi:hypothetical protein
VRRLRGVSRNTSTAPTRLGSKPVQGLLARLGPRFRHRGCQDAAARPITSDRHNLGLLFRPDGAMVGSRILWWMGPGITAKLTSVRVKQLRLILAAAYPWKGRADFGVKSPSRRPNAKCLNGPESIKRSASSEKSARAAGLCQV